MYVYIYILTWNPKCRTWNWARFPCRSFFAGSVHPSWHLAQWVRRVLNWRTLWPSTLQMIYSRFSEDFARFNYSMEEILQCFAHFWVGILWDNGIEVKQSEATSTVFSWCFLVWHVFQMTSCAYPTSWKLGSGVLPCQRFCWSDEVAEWNTTSWLWSSGGTGGMSTSTQQSADQVSWTESRELDRVKRNQEPTNYTTHQWLGYSTPNSLDTQSPNSPVGSIPKSPKRSVWCRLILLTSLAIRGTWAPPLARSFRACSRAWSHRWGGRSGGKNGQGWRFLGPSHSPTSCKLFGEGSWQWGKPPPSCLGSYDPDIPHNWSNYFKLCVVRCSATW